MTNYRIVCTDLQPVIAPRPHQHIVAVGVDTSGNGWANERQTLETVINNIKDTNKQIGYYTVGNFTGKFATVEAAPCQHCGHLIIKTRPDDTRDDNLENMRTCQWSNS